MTQIIIKRPNKWLNPLAVNGIYIDGEKVGCVTGGETREYDTTPGKHTVVSKSRWYGNSNPIEVEVGCDECKIIKLSAVKYTFWIGYIIFICILISMWFVEAQILILLVLGYLVLYYIYMFTIGRNTFWKLKEV